LSLHQTRSLSIFHEAYSQTKIREWLGWQSAAAGFANQEALEQFYTWITGENPKIRNSDDVRGLKQIIDNIDALTALKDDNQSLADAMAIVRSEAKAVRWKPNVKLTLTSLNEMNPETISSLSLADRDTLTQLKNRIVWVLRVNEITVTDDDEE